MYDEKIALNNLPSEEYIYDLLFNTLYLNVKRLPNIKINSKCLEIDRLINSIFAKLYKVCDSAKFEMIENDYVILLFDNGKVWWRDCYGINQIPTLLKSDKIEDNTKRALLDTLNGIIAILKS